MVSAEVSTTQDILSDPSKALDIANSIGQASTRSLLLHGIGSKRTGTGTVPSGAAAAAAAAGGAAGPVPSAAAAAAAPAVVGWGSHGLQQQQQGPSSSAAAGLGLTSTTGGAVAGVYTHTTWAPDAALLKELWSLQQRAHCRVRNMQLALPPASAVRLLGVPDPTGSVPPGCIVVLLQGQYVMQEPALIYRDPGGVGGWGAGAGGEVSRSTQLCSVIIV
jgi:hypothetical protein